MKRTRLIVCALACLVLGALLWSPALAAPRAAPSNDSFAGAKTVKLGGKATAKNVGAATVEAGEPSICSGDTFNTVWYKVRAEVDFPQIFVSTAGSYLPHSYGGTADTAVAVYTGSDIGALTEVACRTMNISDGFAELEFEGVWGETYYIQVGALQGFDFTAASFYRLTVKIVDMRPFPTNSSFEEELAGTWKVKKGGVDDAIVCDDVSFPAFTESCAFRFAGGPKEKTSLTQAVPLPRDIIYSKSHVILAGGVAQVVNAASVQKATFTLTLTYTDGTPPTVVTRALTGIESGGYVWFTALAPVKSKALAGYTLKFLNKSSSGDLLIDNIFVNYYGGAAVREAAILPLPPAPR